MMANKRHDIKKAIDEFKNGHYRAAMRDFKTSLNDDESGEAAYYIGQMYEKGIGYKISIEQAITFYKIGEKKGNINSEKALSSLKISDMVENLDIGVTPEEKKLKLDNYFLDSLGLGELSDLEKSELLSKLYGELEERVGELLTEGMSDDLLDEFGAFVDNDEKEMDRWLNEHNPGYAQSEEYKDFKKHNLGLSVYQLKAQYGAIKWLSFNRPDYPEVVRQVFTELEKKVKNDYAQFLKDNSSEANEYYRTGMDYYWRKDYKEAFEKLEESAKLNNVDAQYRLGLMYDKGMGLESPNHEEAFKFYKMAAESNSKLAQNNLGVMYATGEWIKKDLKQARKWYEAAASQHWGVSESNLGAMYEDGSGGKKDIRKALEYYELAAKDGYELARCYMAGILEDGEGEIKQNLDKAVTIYLDVISHEEDEYPDEEAIAYAKTSLGIIYLTGKGEIKKQLNKAKKYFTEVIKNGSHIGKAANSLGEMFLEGKGVPKSFIRARILFEKGREAGNHKAEKNLSYMDENGK